MSFEFSGGRGGGIEEEGEGAKGVFRREPLGCRRCRPVFTHQLKKDSLPLLSSKSFNRSQLSSFVRFKQSRSSSKDSVQIRKLSSFLEGDSIASPARGGN